MLLSKGMYVTSNGFGSPPGAPDVVAAAISPAPSPAAPPPGASEPAASAAVAASAVAVVLST